jgi:alanine dehydrogenase
MTRILRDADVRQLVGFPEAVTVARDGVIGAFRPATAGGGSVAERSTARYGDGWLRVISGMLPSLDVLGFKAFSLVPGVGVRYLIALYRLSTGEALALVDANHLTVMRTSATAAAAARHYWGAQPIVVGVVGSGLQAQDGLRALASVCTIHQAQVFSPTRSSRERYARAFSAELGFDVVAAGTPADAVRGAEMALCATQTRGTVALSADDVTDLRYISSVSSTLPSQRELDERIIAGAATVIVDTRDALKESGDLIAAHAAGLGAAHVVALASFLETVEPVDSPAVYKSIGSMEQDLSLAYAAWQAAEKAGAGQVIEPIELLKDVR